MVERVRLTAAEFLAQPETMDKQELLNGVVIVSPAPIPAHQQIARAVFRLLDELTSDGELIFAPSDVHLGDDVVQPDIFWIADGGQCGIVDGQYWRGAPDLIVEILSPATAKYDRGAKYDLYQREGVREYWIIDPAMKTLEVYAHDGARFNRHGAYDAQNTFQSPVLNQQTVKVADIFAGV